ncbi:MAG: hypothetical protein ACRD0E_11540, partial [Acidimicrobiales bacterium]
GMGLDATPASATALAQSWRPWRSYALVHLWARPPAPARRTAATRRTAAIRRTAATRSTATKG